MGHLSSVAAAQESRSQTAQETATDGPSSAFVSRSLQLETARELSAFKRKEQDQPAATAGQNPTAALRMLNNRSLENSIHDFRPIAKGVDGLGEGLNSSRSVTNHSKPHFNSGAMRLLEDRILGGN
jgi:hypothetical protein